MGLDMYLYVQKYVSRMDYANVDGTVVAAIRPDFQAMTELLGTDTLIRQDDWTGYTIEVPVGYWRKANAIHGWITTFCADGEDNCQRIYISRENAQELVDLCKQAIRVKEEAPEILPTTSGFFFGSTEYDEWYFQDLQHTIDIFEPLLTSEYADSIHYQASW